MTENWARKRRNDPYYKRAKKENYLSRASYKLMQLDDRFNLIREGDTIIDLGAAPGGWSQVGIERSAPGGLVIAIDIKPIADIEGVLAVQGDIYRKEIIDEVIALLNENGRKMADLLISDMSPNISGIYDVDHARSVGLVKHAMSLCDPLLRNGGRFVAKIFEGDMMRDLTDEARAKFRSVKLHAPDASRDRSSEIYIVCKGYCRK